MRSRFWIRLGKIGIGLVVAYLIVAYALLITIIIRQELAILDPPRVISVFKPNEEGSVLKTRVYNVFGDPVPHAVVVLGEIFVQADNTGAFILDNLEPGYYELEVFAGGYEKYSQKIQIEEGMNRPTIKYDTGLWPQTFLVDFHIFYKTNDEIFGIAGFANGTSEPIYIHKATLFNPRKEKVADLLHDLDGFNYYSEFSSKIKVVEKPRKALEWAAHTVQNGEFPPIQGVFPPGPYTLEVHYASAAGHEAEEYLIFTITDHLDLDNNWNPHLPLENSIE